MRHVIYQEKIWIPVRAHQQRSDPRLKRTATASFRGPAALAILGTVLLIILCLSGPIRAQEGLVSPAAGKEGAEKQKLKLTKAVMCEALEGYTPRYPAVVFSVSRQRVFCFTAFDPVPQKTVIYHKWYRRDVLTATVKLQLNPPRWNTFSNMQLRESDKGPWQVKISDADGKVIRTLRYSITD